MYDACLELSDFSYELQNHFGRGSQICFKQVRVLTSILRQVRVLESMIDYPGQFTKEVEEANQRTVFKGVNIQNGSKWDVKNKRQQFLRSLATNLSTR